MTRAFGNALRTLLGERYPDLILYQRFFRSVHRPQRGKPALLLLNHVFDQDIEALERANHDFTFVTMDAWALRDAGGSMFPPSVESYSVYNAPATEPLRRRYRRVMDRFAGRLEGLGIRAVVAPSDNFFYVRELIPALHAQGIPYLVVDKEGTICPAYFTHFADYIRRECPLIADHILVWSERQKRFWERAGVGNDRITVTGQPRSDFWKQPDRWLRRDQLGIPQLRRTSPMVVFFTYDPWAYTPEYMVVRGEMHWDELRSQTHDALYRFAEAHPDVDVVIKSHPQQTDRAAIESEWRTHGLPNVHLAFGATSSNNLIVNASVIVGFQSTALIEAMLTERPILYTFWDEAVRWVDDLIPFHATEGVTTVRSPDEFVQRLSEAIAQPHTSVVQQQARERFLAEYLPNVDGHAADRTLRRIHQLLA